MHNTFISWRNKSILAAVMACCLLLLATISAFASNVYISDEANVLNKSQVESQASNLSYPVSIYTTNNFSGTNQAFAQRTVSKIANSNMIVMAIDTSNHYIAITGGKSVPLSDSQYSDAIQSFKSNYSNANGGYTQATVGALQTLQSAIGSNGPSSGSSSTNPSPIGSSGLLGGFGTTALCCIGLLVVLGIAAFAFARRRGGGFGRRGAINPMQQGPMYPPNYPNQGYPPNYGQGYNQGGVNPLIPGGIGAVGGGLLGYELGRQQGENEARREDGYYDNNNNFNNGDNNFGGGASGTFGDNSGNDFGGGASGTFGGDSGGGGGSDFGGGSFGGGDAGGGSSGSF